MGKIFLVFVFYILFSCLWGYSRAFAINKIENTPNICYNRLVPKILSNKGNVSNQCDLISFQLNNADRIKPTCDVSLTKLVDHLWSKYFNPELQFNPQVSPKIPILELKISPDNLNSSIFNQIRAWHSKEHKASTENIPACICFDFDYENHILPNGSELKNVTVNILQKTNSSTNWDIVKFKKTMNTEVAINRDMLLTSEGDAKSIAIWSIIALSVASLLYYFFTTADGEVHGKYKCRTLF